MFFSLIGCTNSPTSSNDYITDPTEPAQKHADVRIIASDIRLRFPVEIEMYVKIMNYGPDPAYNVKATLPVLVNDIPVEPLVMSFRTGGRLGVYELAKNTVDRQFDSTWKDVFYGSIVLSWETR